MLRPLALALTLLPWQLPGAEPAPLRFGVDLNQPPISSATPGKPPEGLIPEMIRQLGRTERLRVELIPDHWKHQVEALQAGRLDVLGNVLALESRRAIMDFSIPHTRLKGGVYVPAGAPRLTSVRQLAGKRIAVLEGATNHSIGLMHGAWGGTLVLFPRSAEAHEAVRRRECDVEIARVLVAPDELSGLQFSFLEDLNYDFRFAVRKGDSATLALLNDAIMDLEMAGLSDDLYYKWTGSMQPGPPLRWREYRHIMLPLLGVLAVGLILLVRQYHLRALLAERVRIARDLHDELGNRLSEMQLLTERVQLAPAAATHDFAARLRARLVEASESLNHLVWLLRPQAASWQETAAHLETIARRYLESAGTRHTIDCQVAPEAARRRVPQERSRALLMATRELLKNAIQHARPDSVSLELAVKPHLITLRITDSGPGVDPELALTQGRGLQQLRARLTELGGELQLARLQPGFRVHLQLPQD
jgi:signal transduction histidine kinase